REPDRRHAAVQRGRALRPAPADPSRGRRRRRGARPCLLLARGARGGDRGGRAAGPGPHAGGRRRHWPRVPRPEPGAPRGPRGTARALSAVDGARIGVLEAQILASLVRILPAEEIGAELRPLQVLVDKTG